MSKHLQHNPEESGPNRIPLLRNALELYTPRLEELAGLADRFHQHPDTPVLIQGETGTGKELFCQRIHHGGSIETAGPLIGLNCAAINAGLFEAELFGYEPGSYTGASATGSIGKLAMAEGGTLFLDEVADLPLEQQAKLLRVLEARTWYRIGGRDEQHLRARVVCACNVDLLERVADGRFRRDLYYRLRVAHLRLPALREAPEAIPALARRLLVKIRHRKGRGCERIGEDAEARLSEYPWPGNIRQLKHFLEEACLLFDDPVLDAEMVRSLLPPLSAATAVLRRRETARVRKRTEQIGLNTQSDEFDPQSAAAEDPAAAALLPKNQAWLEPRPEDLPEESLDFEAWQAAVVRAALERHDGSPVKTAAYLGISRKVLYTMRKRYGLL